eukprot:5219335-Prorocentrum_lima.AAC.1
MTAQVGKEEGRGKEWAVLCEVRGEGQATWQNDESGRQREGSGTADAPGSGDAAMRPPEEREGEGKTGAHTPEPRSGGTDGA